MVDNEISFCPLLSVGVFLHLLPRLQRDAGGDDSEVQHKSLLSAAFNLVFPWALTLNLVLKTTH